MCEISVGLCARKCRSLGVQKTASNPLLRELQAVLRCLTWVLGGLFKDSEHSGWLSRADEL